MRRVALIVAALAGIAAAPTTRTTIGQFGAWGAFRDSDPSRCFAIAEPVSGRGGAEPPSLAVTRWRDRPGAGEVHAHLSRPIAEATLEAGDARFELVVNGRDAWARDASDDRRIVATLRRASQLALAGRDMQGRRFHDLYRLEGAASAIDAMRIACR